MSSASSIPEYNFGRLTALGQLHLTMDQQNHSAHQKCPHHSPRQLLWKPLDWALPAAGLRPSGCPPAHHDARPHGCPRGHVRLLLRQMPQLPVLQTSASPTLLVFPEWLTRSGACSGAQHWARVSSCGTGHACFAGFMFWVQSRLSLPVQSANHPKVQAHNQMNDEGSLLMEIQLL